MSICRRQTVASGMRPSDPAEEHALYVRLREEARMLIEREPAMAGVLRPAADAGDFADALCRILVRRLHAAGPMAEMVPILLADALSQDAAISASAARDLLAVLERDPACPGALHVLLNLKGFHALQVYRSAHHLWMDGRREAALYLSSLASLAFGLDIHPAACIGSAVMLDHGSGIVIGETAVIEDDVSILQNVTLGGTGKERGDRHPKIRRGVMIGAGAKILGNIEVGAFSKVAAGSLVLHPIPPRCTVAGIPAAVVRIHRADEIPASSMDQSIF